MATPNYASKHFMRGLVVFINNIRDCNNVKEQEEKIVLKEMAKIRKKLHEQKKLDGYARRKYIAKLLFMYLMGYEADFGYIEALGLLNSAKLPEKLIGHITLGVVLHEDHELIPKLLPPLANDLRSDNEFFVSMALATAANLGGKQISDSLGEQIKQLSQNSHRPMIQKKAILCILRFYRDNPNLFPSASWEGFLGPLLQSPHVSVLSSLLSLLLTLSKSPQHHPFLIPLQSRAIQSYSKMFISKNCPTDYFYYHVPSPWLQVKFLKFIGNFSLPDDSSTLQSLMQIFDSILSNTPNYQTKSKDEKNAYFSVMFECVNVLVKMKCEDSLIEKAGRLLGDLLMDKGSSANHIFLILEVMSFMVRMRPKMVRILREHQTIILRALSTVDVSIRRRSIDLLFGMCDRSSAEQVVGELLKYLATLSTSIDEEYTLREELVRKISIIAEKYSTRYKWYVDVMLQLITIAGDAMTDVVWYRSIKIITNQVDIQEYATSTLFEALSNPNCNLTTIKLGAFILGEYGHLIAHKPGMNATSQFNVINERFKTTTDIRCKSIMLSTYLKFVRNFPELRDLVMNVFGKYSTFIDQEIQQRACEYAQLLALKDQSLLSIVCSIMPPYENFKADEPGEEFHEEIGNLKIESSEEIDGVAYMKAPSRGLVEESKPMPVLSTNNSAFQSNPSKLNPALSSNPSLPPTSKIASTSSNTANIPHQSSAPSLGPAPPLPPFNPKRHVVDSDSSDEDSTEKRSQLEREENLRRQQEQIEERERQVLEQQKNIELMKLPSINTDKERKKLEKQKRKIEKREEALRQGTEMAKVALNRAHMQKTAEQQQKELSLLSMAQALAEKERELMEIEKRLAQETLEKEQKLQEQAKQAEQQILKRVLNEKQKQEQKLVEAVGITKKYLEGQQLSWQQQQLMEYQQREKELQERELRLKEQEELLKRSLQQEENVLRQKIMEEANRRQQQQILEQKRLESLKHEQDRLQKLELIRTTTEQERLKAIEIERVQTLAQLQSLEQENMKAVAAEKEKLQALALQYKAREQERLQALALAEKERITALAQQEEERLRLIAAEQQRLIENEREKARAVLLQQQKAQREEAEALRLMILKQQEAAIRQQQELALRQQQEAALRQQQEVALRQQQEAILRQQQEALLRSQQQEALLRSQQQEAAILQQEAAIRQQENALRQKEMALFQQEAALKQKAENAMRQQQEAALRQQQETALRQQQEAALRQQQEAALKQQQEAALREAALRQQQEAALKQQQENALRQQQEYALRLQQENVLRQQQEVSMRETALRQQQENAIRQQQENTLRQQQESALRQQQENSIRQQQENVLRQQQEMALRQQQEIAMKQQKEASLKQQQEAFRLQQQKESAFRLPENVLGPQPSMSLPMVPIQFTAETTRPQTIASHTLTADERATKATRKLTIVDSGVLYEDDSIQIALKSDYQRGEGRLDFYIANRTLEQVSGLRILVPPVSYVTSRLTPPPPTIAPQSQAVFQIIYKCEVPFESYPDIQFSMLVRGLSKILKLKVPLAITKFCDPQPCEAQHWFGAWNQIKGFPLEIQNMFQAVTANVVHIQELLSKGFRFAVISGVDTNPLNLVGASFFRSTQGEFPCFARLETNPSAGMIRLTLKSSNAQLTSSLRNIFLLHLGVESSQGQPSQSSLPSMPSLPSQSSQPSQPSFPKGW